MHPRIYPGVDPELYPGVDYGGSQNLPLPPRIYPSFQQLYATLPEATPPSQNIPLLSTTICDPPRIYPSLPEYTPLFNNYNITRPSQNRPHPPKIHPPPFSTTLCDAPRIYPPSQNIQVTHLFNKHNTLSLCRVNADAGPTLNHHMLNVLFSQ